MVQFLHIPKPLGDITFEDDLINSSVTKLQGGLYLGDTDNVPTIRKAYPQEDDQPEMPEGGKLPAILVSADMARSEQSMCQRWEWWYDITFDVLCYEGQRREGRKKCGRIRDEIKATFEVEVNGTTDFLTNNYPVWVDIPSISTGRIQTGLKNNSHVFWARLVIPVSILWKEPTV